MFLDLYILCNQLFFLLLNTCFLWLIVDLNLLLFILFFLLFILLGFCCFSQSRFDICFLVYLFQNFNFLLLFAYFFREILHTKLINFITCSWQDFSCKNQTVETELLEYEWSSLKITSKGFLKVLNLLHSFHKLYTRFASDLVGELIWFEDLIGNLVYRDLHSFSQKFPLIFVEVLRLNLAFFYVVPVVIHVSFYKSV